MAEAGVCAGGVRGEGEIPAGDATEFGRMKSSRFIASEVGVSEVVLASRSFAIPEGLLVGWLLELHSDGLLVDSSKLMRTKKCNTPSLLSLLALQVHGHHPPCQIVHALLVG